MKNLNENTNNAKLGRLLDRSEATRIQEVVSAWKQSGYLNGLKGRDLGKMAVLAENQKRHILKENNTTADMAIFDTIAIPMIRRTNSLMVTPNIVSVLPLSYPSGIAFFLDYEVTTNDDAGKVPFTSTPTWEGKSGYDRFYNNAGFDTSKGRPIDRGFFRATIGTTPASGIASGDTLNSWRVTNIDLGGTGVMNVVEVEVDMAAIGGMTMDNFATLKTYLYKMSVSTPVTNIGTVLVEGTDYFVQKSIQPYGSPFLPSANITSGQSASGNSSNQNPPPASTGGGLQGPATGNGKLKIKIIPTDVNKGDNWILGVGFNDYQNLELNPQNSSQLRMKISSAPIQTVIHKLKTSWTIELAQDLMAYHAVDAESELTQFMSEEIAQEKDRMIIKDLILGAAHYEVWNADFENAIGNDPTTTVFRGVEGTYNQTLMYKINNIDGKIKKSTRRGGANWILISAEGATKIANLDTFKPVEGDEEGTKFAGGVEKIGKVNTRFDIYVDPFLPADICLVGRKGTSFFDCGYVYAPYIEFMLGPVINDPSTGNPIRFVSSRFGRAILNNKFFGVVRMKGIEVFDVV